MSVSSNEDFTFAVGFPVTGWGNDYAGNVRRAKDKCERQPRTNKTREHLKAPLHEGSPPTLTQYRGVTALADVLPECVPLPPKGSETNESGRRLVVP